MRGVSVMGHIIMESLIMATSWIWLWRLSWLSQASRGTSNEIVRSEWMEWGNFSISGRVQKEWPLKYQAKALNNTRSAIEMSFKLATALGSALTLLITSVQLKLFKTMGLHLRTWALITSEQPWHENSSDPQGIRTRSNSVIKLPYRDDICWPHQYNLIRLISIWELIDSIAECLNAQEGLISVSMSELVLKCVSMQHLCRFPGDAD